jgi:hypothetical protein
MEQAQAEDFTNLFLDQGKPQCIPPIILDIFLITIIMLCLSVH